MIKVEFYFDIGSPYSYLAYKRLLQIKANIIWKPMLLGGVFQATGNKSPVEFAFKRAYGAQDMQRWAKHYGVKMEMPAVFPVNTLAVMRAATGYLSQDKAKFLRYIDCIFNAMFQEPQALGEAQVLGALLAKNGFTDFLEVINMQEVKDKLKATTEEAVARGVFGAPTFFVGDQMFFGQDRLLFVEQLL